jgi:hypothetical protein
LGSRQKTCGSKACQLAHRSLYRKNYRTQNLEAELGYQQKQRETRGPDYWKNYRKAHPEYRARNRAGARLRKELLKVGLQRQLDIVQLVDPPEKLGVVVEFVTSHRSLLKECVCNPAA